MSDPSLQPDPLALERLRELADAEGRSIEDVYSEALHVGIELLLTGSTQAREDLQGLQTVQEDLLTLSNVIGPKIAAIQQLLVHWSASSDPRGASESDLASALEAQGQEQWAADVGRYGLAVPRPPAELNADTPAF